MTPTVTPHASGSSDLCDMSATKLVAGYRSRAFSPVEVTRAILARTEHLNPTLNAFFFTASDAALQAARASEDRWHRSAPLGALDGVPVSIKDSIAVAGMPMYRGAAPFRQRGPSQVNAPPAARLAESGAILFGKTTMPDFGLLGAGVSSAYGTTHNPWNIAMNTGGSSSGSAAAVAARLGPLTVGTDLAGSVRMPAALCGLATLKPTQGRIPHLPPSTMRSAGPIARSIEDVALLFRVLTGPDARDFGSLPPDAVTYDDLSIPNLKGWRVGVVDDMGFGKRAEPAIAQACLRAASFLAEAGAEIATVGPLVDLDPTDAFVKIFGSRAGHEAAHLSDEERSQLHPAIQQTIAQTRSLSAEAFLAASDEIDRAKATVVARTAPYDIVIMPAVPVVSFAANDISPDPENPYALITFTSMFNQTGQPAAVVCGGFNKERLPIGIQLIGRRHDDWRVLQAAAFCEAARDLRFDWPL
ncbi:Asp-tRNA(Asn)/Glu-tRNA(Gln) amidotransferase A subunit family amidase [Bradyrhizobium sp. USDA 4369]